jgi:hypothetical protein
MASKALFAALHIGLFTTLSGTSMTMDDLVSKVPEGVTERKLVTLVTCLTSIGLLQQERSGRDAQGFLISNVPAAEAFLVRGAKYEFGDYLRFQSDQQMNPFTQHLPPAILGENASAEVYRLC